jgi:hypothetical protein
MQEQVPAGDYGIARRPPPAFILEQGAVEPDRTVEIVERDDRAVEQLCRHRARPVLRDDSGRHFCPERLRFTWNAGDGRSGPWNRP